MICSALLKAGPPEAELGEEEGERFDPQLLTFFNINHKPDLDQASKPVEDGDC